MMISVYKPYHNYLGNEMVQFLFHQQALDLLIRTNMLIADYLEISNTELIQKKSTGRINTKPKYLLSTFNCTKEN